MQNWKQIMYIKKTCIFNFIAQTAMVSSGLSTPKQSKLFSFKDSDTTSLIY